LQSSVHHKVNVYGIGDGSKVDVSGAGYADGGDANDYGVYQSCADRDIVELTPVLVHLVCRR